MDQVQRDLRNWTAGRLDLEELPEIVWKVLSHQGYVKSVINGETSRTTLTEWAQTLLPYGEALDLSAQETEIEEESLESPAADDNEIQRGKVVAEYLALRMAMEPLVDVFRVTLEMFTQTDPRQVIKKLQDDPQDWRDYIGNQRTQTEERFVTQLEEFSKVVVRDVAGYWTEEEAIAFVLADRVASRDPVQIDNKEESPEETGAINLRIEPWISTQTLVRFFQYERDRKVGRRPRTIAPRNLAVARFVFLVMRGMWYRQIPPHVTVQEGSRGIWYEEILRRYSWLGSDKGKGTPSWPRVMALWNQYNLEEQYDNTRRFYKDFHRGVRAIVPPYSTSHTRDTV